MQRAAVVILNFNGRAYLEKFIPAVKERMLEGVSLVVADNASTDDSVAFLRAAHPDVSLVKLESNLGYAGGYNRALKSVEATYYILLNSDVEPGEGWLFALLEYMDAHPATAAAQPRIRDYNNPHKFEYAGAAGGFIDALGIPFCRGRIFNTCEEDLGQYTEDVPLAWASGACLIIRSHLFHKYGGFCPDFFAHMEEIDLCWRLRNAGHCIGVAHEALVYHVGGGTLSAGSPRKTMLNYRNNLATVIRNDYGTFFWLRFILRLIQDGVAALHLLLTRGISHFTAVIEAHFAIYGQWRRWMKERAALRAQATCLSREGHFTKSIVSHYYLFGIRRFSALPKSDFPSQTLAK